MSKPVCIPLRCNYVQSVDNQKDTEVSEIQSSFEEANEIHEILKKNLRSAIQHVEKTLKKYFPEEFGTRIIVRLPQTTTEGQSPLLSSSEDESQVSDLDEWSDESQVLDLDEWSSDSENELGEEDEISFAEVGKELSDAAKKLHKSADRLLRS